jgi:hypothetical protein
LTAASVAGAHPETTSNPTAVSPPSINLARILRIF